MRGGTSKGPFFRESDLPSDVATRDKVLLAVMGSPDKRQIDGLGGAHPLTSKVGIVRPSATPGVDLDFLFAQLQPDKDTVDTTPNCGNMLAAVVPFALETGMVEATGRDSTFRVLTLNTDMQCDITVQTPGGVVNMRATRASTARRGPPRRSRSIFSTPPARSARRCCRPATSRTDRGDRRGIRAVSRRRHLHRQRHAAGDLQRRDVGRTGYESVAELNADRN